METYLLTIAIPTYNRASLLKGLLENIYSETDNCSHLGDVQIVVVDGKSEDNTLKVIEDYIIRDNFKYYRRDKREGIDKDIMKCVEFSDGKYCWLFSDDDRLTDGSIEHILNTLRTEINVSGCFCNRISVDCCLRNKVAEINGWIGKIIKKDYMFTNKAECFKYIGMDFGFISSQIVNRLEWQKVVEEENLEDLYDSYYLMVHIIGKMLDKEFKWLYINRPMLMQRTGNDSLLKSSGVIKRQVIEHNSFEKILNRHYDRNSEEYKYFFKKMVFRLPRVIANFKSQNIDYETQMQLFKIYYSKYKRYYIFWFIVAPVFIIPNSVFYVIKKAYYKIITSCLK